MLWFTYAIGTPGINGQRARPVDRGARLGQLRMKILIVDDHALICDALQGMLKKLKRGVIVLEASNSQQALEATESHSDINLILLDLNLPDRDGLSPLTELRERYPAIAIVVLSAAQDRTNVQNALDLGAVGYIPKSARREVMLSALQLIFAGGVYIPPETLSREEISFSVPIHSIRTDPSSRLPKSAYPADNWKFSRC